MTLLIAAPLIHPLKELNFAGSWNSLKRFEILVIRFVKYCRRFKQGPFSKFAYSSLILLIAAPLIHPIKELNFAGRWNSLKDYVRFEKGKLHNVTLVLDDILQAKRFPLDPVEDK